MSKPRTCDNCSNCVLVDFGYSNYTVEGTYVHCSQKKLPEDGFDRFYGEDKRLKIAEKCDLFAEGLPLTVDVDQEGPFTDEEKAKARLVGVEFYEDKYK